MPHRIKKRQLTKLIRNAVAESSKGGYEICGLIVDTGYFLELVQVKNKKKEAAHLLFIPLRSEE